MTVFNYPIVLTVYLIKGLIKIGRVNCYLAYHRTITESLECWMPKPISILERKTKIHEKYFLHTG
jgi:hypothetical protein